MGMTWADGKGDTEREEHVRVIRRALEIGANVVDTADVYGPFTNEELSAKLSLDIAPALSSPRRWGS
jgi:aryl-alcohol dehydrogenase-like predicted oxidoreductase